MKQTGQTLPHRLLQALRVSLFVAFGALCLNGAMAQGTQAPLNLGTIIEKSNNERPVYLKLPETVPVPASNPIKSEAAEAGQATPQPGTEAAAAAPQETTAPTDALEPTSPSSVEVDAEAETPLTAGAAETAEALAARQEPEKPKIEPGGIARLELTALLSDDEQILQRGINWRIFSDEKDAEGHLPMLNNVEGGPLEVDLQPGSYIVYAGYGYANLTKRVILPKAGDYRESFNLHAGAMRLNAVAAGDIPLDSNILKFDIYTGEDADTGAHTLLIKNVKPDHVVKLSQGVYHVVSNYGSANAKVRGDVEITEGKLINVTMIHNAAKVTLRLVSEPGGEALANTIWTVFTPGGDVVKRAIGAFPTLALAAGDYTAIAKQGNEVYNRDFSVSPGLNRDIEVLATAQ
ncbi:hypothetical protein [Cohaesibacter haloalkalitolerans]|uniref:hypothetical protein n=1 Tax=Cohaesibacter haloalkalitolerans TaxID=1162980 RepID=UPI0013C43E09|nr:hypothetical protein [Cohaesibacter haloalkalitolerans]